MADRLPPQNLDAERAVLGSLLRDNDCIADVLLLLGAGDFYLDAHQKIFRAVVSLFDAGRPIDLVTLHDDLRRRHELENIGDAPYLAQLWDAAPTAANARHYAGLVRDRSLLRSLIHAGTEILRDAYDPTGPAEEVLEEAERRILAVSELGALGETRTLGSVLAETFQRIDGRMNRGKNLAVPTGFVDLDRLTCGLQPGELILLAARPSCGKTALSLSIIRHVVVKERLPVLFVSLEQSRVEIGERLLCAQSRMDGQRLRKGLLSREDLDALAAAADELQGGGLLHVDDTAAQTVSRIGANARRLKRTAGIRLLVIDYLQLIEPDNPRASKYEQVSTISRRLKHVARESDLPVLALAQLNRESEARASGRPRLADLRDSGSLEQDGDLILLLHKLESQGSVDVINVQVEKQRNGPTGDVPLAFCRPSMRFENYAYEDTPHETNGRF